MFVQVVQAKVKDAEAVRRQNEKWANDIMPGVKGFLGSTMGITADGELIAIARFESADAALVNSQSAAQSEWWEETSKYLEDPMFHDCTVVELMGEGGSDKAGFVQVIQGKVTDMDRAIELDREMTDQLSGARPDIIGGLVAWHPENARFTNVIYFTSEAEAREKEKEATGAPEFAKYMEEYEKISDGEPKFLDLTDPWHASP
jgi:hypothetical protein